MAGSNTGFSAVTDIPRAYEKYIGGHPLRELLLLGGAGGLTGYALGKPITKALLNTIPATSGASPEEKERTMDELERDKTLRTIRMILAGMGGLAGVGYTAMKHGQFGAGFRGFAQSMVDPRYWEKNPAERQAALARYRKSYYGMPYWSMRRFYSSGRRQFQKNEAEDLGIFNAPRVPVHTSMELLAADPFLRLNEKTVSNQILESAGDRGSGLVSGHDLMQSAIQAGAGAGVGYVFGRVAGSLLSLPTPVTKRLSTAGALAGAIINTGLFSEVLDHAT